MATRREAPRRIHPWHLAFWALSDRPEALIVLAATMIGVAAAELSLPWLLARAVDAAVETRDIAAVNRYGLLMVALIAVLYGIHVVYLRAETRVVFRGIFRLRRLLYSRLLDQPVGYFARRKTGELIHRVLNDTEVLDSHGVYLISDLPFSLLTVAGILILMARANLQLALLVVAFLAAASTVSVSFGRPLPTLRTLIQSAGARLAARLQEGLSGIRTVKSFGRERHEQTRLDALSREAAGLEVKEGRVGALIAPLLELMELLGLVLIVWYGARLVAAGVMTPGVLVAFIAYMELLSEPLSRGDQFYRHVQICRGVAHRLAEFLNDMHPPSPARGSARPGGPMAVHFERVGFSYPGAGRRAVDGVTFEAHPGDLLAIAGRNGAGKSTLMDLLLGFWRPDEGRILVAECPLEAWDEDARRAAIGTMPQDVFLFHASLADNIGYGRLGAGRHEIDAAAAAAGLGPLLQRLPDGLDTPVGERGQRLSGGERQRVSLARILLKDPPILVFDEPTSGLDGEAVRDLHQALVRLARGRTVLVIAHRPDVLALATRVVLLDAGRLIATGTHAELLATNGIYASLMKVPQSVHGG